MDEPKSVGAGQVHGVIGAGQHLSPNRAAGRTSRRGSAVEIVGRHAGRGGRGIGTVEPGRVDSIAGLASIWRSCGVEVPAHATQRVAGTIAGQIGRVSHCAVIAGYTIEPKIRSTTQSL